MRAWADRHLNWAYVLIIIGAWIVSLAISGLSLLLLAGTVSNEVKAELVTGVPGMLGLMIIPLSILLASAWVLEKKGRSKMWLAFYILGIIPCVGATLCLGSKNKGHSGQRCI